MVSKDFTSLYGAELPEVSRERKIKRWMVIYLAGLKKGTFHRVFCRGEII